MRRTVAVTKCMQRTFSTAQWRALLAQLGAWKACPKTLICEHGGGFVWDFVRFRRLSKGTQVCTRHARVLRGLPCATRTGRRCLCRWAAAWCAVGVLAAHLTLSTMRNCCGRACAPAAHERPECAWSCESVRCTMQRGLMHLLPARTADLYLHPPFQITCETCACACKRPAVACPSVPEDVACCLPSALASVESVRRRTTSTLSRSWWGLRATLA